MKQGMTRDQAEEPTEATEPTEPTQAFSPASTKFPREQYPWALEDPLKLFDQWMAEAEAAEINDPNAAALATATSDGVPSVRMVLVKGVDSRGFRFFTNAGSQKGTELKDNPNAALCLHWKSLRRQVRVAGAVEALAENEVAEYFHTRSRRSQIGAAVSAQSRQLADRTMLEQAVRQFGEQHSGEIPLPAYWRGYLVVPRSLEFWKDGPDRLHDRVVYRRDSVEAAWAQMALYP
jgi:pyridoxamine 5'-phosphate oxidase